MRSALVWVELAVVLGGCTAPQPGVACRAEGAGCACAWSPQLNTRACAAPAPVGVCWTRGDLTMTGTCECAPAGCVGHESYCFCGVGRRSDFDSCADGDAADRTCCQSPDGCDCMYGSARALVCPERSVPVDQCNTEMVRTTLLATGARVVASCSPYAP